MLAQQIARGIVIGILYLFITQANDMSLENVVLFVFVYLVMVNGASVAGIDPNVITTAFLTKTVFTVVDERIKRKQEVKDDLPAKQ